MKYLFILGIIVGLVVMAWWYRHNPKKMNDAVDKAEKKIKGE